MAPRKPKRHGRPKRTTVFKIKVYQKSGRGLDNIDIYDLKEAFTEENFEQLIEDF